MFFDQSFIYSIITAFAISLISIIGAIIFIFKGVFLKKLALVLVAFSTGALLGGAFFHLLPESITGESLTPYLFIVLGIVIFYLLERFLKWRHCHNDDSCPIHTFTYMSLLGDGLHNFIDGLVIFTAFCLGNEAGIATAIAIASHEIPQELGDLGILIHGGFSKSKAIIYNLLSATMALIGVVVGFFLFSFSDNIFQILLPFAAGGFIYISMSDLMPELHKEKSLKRSFLYFLSFLLGLAFMYLIKIIFE